MDLMSIKWHFVIYALINWAFQRKADLINLTTVIYLGVILGEAGNPESLQSQLQ